MTFQSTAPVAGGVLVSETVILHLQIHVVRTVAATASSDA